MIVCSSPPKVPRVTAIAPVCPPHPHLSTPLHVAAVLWAQTRSSKAGLVQVLFASGEHSQRLYGAMPRAAEARRLAAAITTPPRVAGLSPEPSPGGERSGSGVKSPLSSSVARRMATSPGGDSDGDASDGGAALLGGLAAPPRPAGAWGHFIGTFLEPDALLSRDAKVFPIEFIVVSTSQLIGAWHPSQTTISEIRGALKH